ncbi:MAG: hypothetical protein WDO13_19310 [Verrucomicrobiota bacterium]
MTKGLAVESSRCSLAPPLIATHHSAGKGERSFGRSPNGTVTQPSGVSTITPLSVSEARTPS